ncbi:MAG: hybrid sensor histidine kinase/response regulator [Burkholderiaceae bacterium]
MNAVLSDEVAQLRAELRRAQDALAEARAERDLAREQAVEARAQRYAFLAGLAHDLRNPLAPLSNGIELLRLTDADPAGRLRTRGIMERQIGHLMRIADELSDLARLSAGNAPLQDAPFALGPELQRFAQERNDALRSQEMAVALDPEIAGAPALRGDASRIVQAIGRLVDDIARHAEHGSSIAIRASAGDGTIALRIGTTSDLDEPAAGARVAANDDRRPFEEVDASAMGLGVNLARQLAALHGGSLRVERPVGARRARFTLVLPVDADAPAVASSAEAVEGVEPALAVLLADDNADFAHSFGTMLELLGHRVEIVHDGVAAVAAIGRSRPDIAFLDLSLPALDVGEAVRRVRGEGGARAGVVVAVTGRGAGDDRVRAAEAGFDRILVKPFSMQEVRDALDLAHAARPGSPRPVPGGFGSRAA